MGAWGGGHEPWSLSLRTKESRTLHRVCVSLDHHAGPTRDTGFRSSKGGGPWGNKGQTRLSQGKALPQADGRKEVSTAQWEGVGRRELLVLKGEIYQSSMVPIVTTPFVCTYSE